MTPPPFLRPFLESTSIQLLVFLLSLCVFGLIDEIFVSRSLISTSGSVITWMFMCGGWIPGLVGILTMTIFARTALLFFILASVLTYLGAIAFFFMTELHSTTHDPLGGAAVGIVWVINWFCGTLLGLFAKFARNKWHIRSK